MSKDRKIYFAEKLTNVGQYVFSRGNIDEAEIYLQRAIDIYPIAHAKALLATILAEKEKATDKSNKSNDSNQKNKNENEDSSQIDDDMINAEKCIVIAEKALDSGNYGKAERFLLKSIRFYPTPQAEILLWVVENKIKNSKGSENSSKEPDNESGNQNRSSNESTEQGNSARPGNDIIDAERCINIAINALSSGNVMKAERFLLKAERIWPSEHAKNLLMLIRSEKTYGTYGRNSGAKVSKSFVGESVPKEEPIRKESTEEQLAAIRSVTEGKNDYEILGVPEGSTLPVIKKAQRKLTLLLHPDKNREPGAKEAFMTVNDAAERLKTKVNRS